MNTVLEILNKTTAFFQHKGIPDPRLDAQYILAHGLKMDRMELYLNFDRPLSERELEALRPLVARRNNVTTLLAAECIEQSITLSSRSQRTRRISVELRRVRHCKKQLQIARHAQSRFGRKKSLRLSLRLIRR